MALCSPRTNAHDSLMLPIIEEDETKERVHLDFLMATDCEIVNYYHYFVSEIYGLGKR